jgi:hypothetical protein
MRVDIIFSKILEIVSMRTMTRKEEGELLLSLLGLGRTMPLAFLRAGGWYPYWRRGERTSGKSDGEWRWIRFQTR